MTTDGNSSKRIGLRSDKQWKQLQNYICKIDNFYPTPGSEVKDGEVITQLHNLPYAMFDIECYRIPKKIYVSGFCTHREDFENLWSLFKEFDLTDNQEIILFWSKNHYKKMWAKPFSLAMPKMLLMVCPKGTYSSNSRTKWTRGQSIADLSEKLNASICFLPQVMRK